MNRINKIYIYKQDSSIFIISQKYRNGYAFIFVRHPHLVYSLHEIDSEDARGPGAISIGFTRITAIL